MRFATLAIIFFAASCTASDPLTPFRSLRRGMTIDQGRAIVGPPSRQTGSGLAIDVYQLHDGTDVWVGYAGSSGLLYVRHGKNNLLPSGG